MYLTNMCFGGLRPPSEIRLACAGLDQRGDISSVVHFGTKEAKNLHGWDNG